MKIKIIIFIFCTSIGLVLSNHSYSQAKNLDKDLFLNKNAVQINLGYYLVYATININYERILKQNIGKKKTSFFTRIGYGLQDHWGGSGMYVNNQYGFLFSKANSHLELSIGPCYWYDWIDHELESDLPTLNILSGHVFICPSIGWRHQKPDGRFIFRTGASLPESIYAGVGFAF